MQVTLHLEPHGVSLVVQYFPFFHRHFHKHGISLTEADPRGNSNTRGGIRDYPILSPGRLRARNSLKQLLCGEGMGGLACGSGRIEGMTAGPSRTIERRLAARAASLILRSGLSNSIRILEVEPESQLNKAGMAAESLIGLIELRRPGL